MQEDFGTWASFHADQYGQPSINILESRPMEGSWGAGRPRDADKEESAGTWASWHTDQYG